MSRAPAAQQEPEGESEALDVVRAQLREAVAARKCHTCGCLHRTVKELAGTEAGKGPLAGVLREAQQVLAPLKYDCLGCTVCFPALAASAFAEAQPQAAEGMAMCPTEAPQARAGWPPLPGDYHMVRYSAPVAVCTLNSDTLGQQLARAAPEGLAIVGSLHTENLGIERIIQNVLANPYIRFLVVCGEDTQQSVGHLPGQSLVSLFTQGLDEKGRIQGAAGKRPFLKNVTPAQVAAFLKQVEVVPLLGETREAVVREHIQATAARAPGLFSGAPEAPPVRHVQARASDILVQDPAGFLVVYVDRAAGSLALEHYTNAGVLDFLITGGTAVAVYSEAIAQGLLSRLDHAAYLGRELARAESALRTGEPYVQDRAPGEEAPAPAVPSSELVDAAEVLATLNMLAASSCGCGSSCAPAGAKEET
jgi:tetrahydromethanopterin S-methyltransferase subunit A